MRAFITVAASVAALLTITGQAQAQNNRSFVSGHGSDSNMCTLANPCRTFAQALTATNSGGEIVVLDSAGYGPLTINKSITITNPGGVEAGITAAAGATAITINPSSSIVVTLRGLTLEGAGVGQSGITFSPTAGGTINIIDCVVKDFTGIGVAITPIVNSALKVDVLIANSFVLNNAGSGIAISPQNNTSANGVITYGIDHTTVAGNGTSGNDAGILVNSTFGGQGTLISGTISSIHAQQNNIGINFFASGIAPQGIVKNSVVTGNGNGGVGEDISNFDSIVFLADSNVIIFIQNNSSTGVTYSDGTNIPNVSGPSVFGSPLKSVSHF